MSGKINAFIRNPALLFMSLGHRNLFNWIPDETYLKIAFYIRIGHKLNLEHPLSFNEKLQWLKLNDRNELYTQLVDKYEVRSYIANKIGKEYLIPLVGGPWDTFDEIDFDQLPQQFVLKCTHDSGGTIICRDKSRFNIFAARKKINNCLKHNFFWGLREWPYKNIKPRIIAEKYMVDDSETELRDYKFLCFGGTVRCSFVCTNRFGSGLNVTFYDRDWRRMPFERMYQIDPKEIKKPNRYLEMINIAEKLSSGMKFVRIDLYEVEGKVYFGEVTFFPGSGFERFNPQEWDIKLGEYIRLPCDIRERE